MPATGVFRGMKSDGRRRFFRLQRDGRRCRRRVHIRRRVGLVELQLESEHTRRGEGGSQGVAQRAPPNTSRRR